MPDHSTSRLGLCVALFVVLLSVPGRHATAEPGRIAYIHHTGDLYTIRPDGTDRRQLASGELLQPVSGAVPSFFSVSPAQSRSASRAAYSWPLWSPGGERLACFRIVLDEHGQTGQLYIFDVASSRVLNAYTEPGLRPIYAYWAPDGHHLAVLRNRADTLSLDLWPAVGWQAPTLLARGAPFYFDWRADAAALLVHHGPSGQTEQPSGHAVGLLDIESGQRKTVSHSPASFGAPSWSFDSRWMAYGDGRQRPVSLMIAPADGSSPKPFARVSQRIAIGWSPTQTLVAVATTSVPGGAVFEELRLIDIASGQIRRLVTEPFIAYFWSPDGQRIVYARRRPGSRLGTWVVVSVASGQTSEVIDFAPSRTLSQVFHYFDQYALSHRLWSPDSQRFVFAGSAGSDADPLLGLRHPQVYVVEAKAQAIPQVVADGHIAFWSPR